MQVDIVHYGKRKPCKFAGLTKAIKNLMADFYRVWSCHHYSLGKVAAYTQAMDNYVGILLVNIINNTRSCNLKKG